MSVGPKFSRTGVLIRRDEDMDIDAAEGRVPCDGGGRTWSDAATSQGVSAATSSMERGTEQTLP